MPTRRKGRGESARLEHCPECGGVETRNYVYFKRGDRIRVYNECARCGRFVSRYTLCGYTSDKSYESLLERMRHTRLTSGKRTMKIVEGAGEDVRLEFDRVRELVREDEDERKIEQIIQEDFEDRT